MPKIVDNYVLERKIGSGQFGEVFKGYNKQSNVDIAVKSVRRELLKGKFHELLENEIKVLFIFQKNYFSSKWIEKYL